MKEKGDDARDLADMERKVSERRRWRRAPDALPPPLSVPVTVALDDAGVQLFREQVLIVLADYQTMGPKFVQSEGTRIDVANRVVNNLRAVAGLPGQHAHRKPAVTADSPHAVVQVLATYAGRAAAESDVRDLRLNKEAVAVVLVSAFNRALRAPRRPRAASAPPAGKRRRSAG